MRILILSKNRVDEIDHRIFYQEDYGHDNFSDITEYVKAWMPLPEPYKMQGGVKNERSDR